eukprot:9226681-Pyramimonas_sp.AAC.1
MRTQASLRPLLLREEAVAFYMATDSDALVRLNVVLTTQRGWQQSFRQSFQLRCSLLRLG